MTEFDKNNKDAALAIVADEDKISKALVRSKMPARDIGYNNGGGFNSTKGKVKPLSSKAKGSGGANLEHLDALYQQRRH